MTCPRCDSLARQLAEAQDELAAYKARPDEHAAFCNVLRIGGAPVRLLVALLENPGVIVSQDRARSLSSGNRVVGVNVVPTNVSRLRAALIWCGVRGSSVRTVRGRGYVITPDDAARIRGLIA